MLSSLFFSLPAETEVIAAGEVLRRRNEVLTSVLHLENGRVLRGVLDDGCLRHQLGVVEAPFWLDAASAVLGKPLPVDMVADTRLEQLDMALRAGPRLQQCVRQPDARLAIEQALAALEDKQGVLWIQTGEGHGGATLALELARQWAGRA